MNAVLQNLLKLQAIEFDENVNEETNTETAIADLRSKVPDPILGHYDRLVARGKKGVAIVRNQVCTGCHMRLPIAVIMTLMRDEDIQLCDSCGRYLFLPETEKNPELEAAPEAPKPEKKPRSKRKAAVKAA